MPESPYTSPAAPTEPTADQAKLHKDLANAKKANQYTLLLIPIIGITTALQYAGIFSTGSLPPWFGALALGVCVLQFIVLQFKIKKLEKAAGRF